LSDDQSDRPVAQSVQSPQVVTLLLSSKNLSLPQKVLAGHYLREQLALRLDCPLSEVWWVWGGIGLSFVFERAVHHRLVAAAWQQIGQVSTNSFRRCRSRAAETIRQWSQQVAPMLLWRARFSCLGHSEQDWDETKTLGLPISDFEESLRDLLTQTPVTVLSDEGGDQVIGAPKFRHHLLFVKAQRREVRLQTTRRGHWLSWTATSLRAPLGYLIHSLIGQGLTGLWIGIFREKPPLAYEVSASWHLHPISGEVYLYAAGKPEDLPLIQSEGRRLIDALRRGVITSQDLERAKQLALNRWVLLQSHPVERGKMVSAWLAAGYRLEEFRSLPETILSFGVADLKQAFKTAPIVFSEYTVLPE
ncbi:MAG: hypothetical protein NZ959_10035, partial [Armatimonadetes bacterium]|nr:hypothetical protein [Armatimonadota bacterium]MDW8122822.1 hypothetical protein [Armatimonadota bacterium]